jgi:hypothetical protein
MSGLRKQERSAILYRLYAKLIKILERHPRQRYNSSSIRRTPVVPGYVSELIERRESLRVLPEGRSKDNTCIRKALQYISGKPKDKLMAIERASLLILTPARI